MRVSPRHAKWHDSTGVNESAQFIRRLKGAPRNSAVFNPWWESDTETDIGPAAPKMRRRQLAAYFAGRLGRAKIALVGEALGYQGGHFSGIAMTSERLLLGHKADAGIDPRDVLPGLKPRRTSKPDLIKYGFSEPTATIVWVRCSRSEWVRVSLCCGTHFHGIRLTNDRGFSAIADQQAKSYTAAPTCWQRFLRCLSSR